MKAKNGISTIEKIRKYKEQKEFPNKNELFWDIKQQQASDDEAPEEMSFQGFTKKSSVKMTKMSSKAKKALKEEKASELSSKESQNVDKKKTSKLDKLEENVEDEENSDLEDEYSETEDTITDNLNQKSITKTIIKPKVPFNFKSSLLLRKRKEGHLYLDRQKQNLYIKKQKFA
ncbi:Hypothetical protein SRAE_0000032600 [Strongyloides ratti]|uniref:Uncharacterized protein n=1 Tax=Strongyloides ratti TaxID=34506 RepID=A0A090L182_STRRB|nr:Hypothetical protein SRAE_0000032600 [Strongyloides ratti]CEF61199.1 Hypothetical protein SRAE_0000032600 [Strongyloides ratti]